MPSRKIEDLDPVLAEAWKKAEAEYEAKFPENNVIVTCTHRTNVEQNELYASGRTKAGSILTKARAGQSPHNLYPAKAFDIAFIGLDKQLDWNMKHFVNFVKIIKEIEPRIDWGGDFKSFKDAPHFELNGWKQSKK